MANACLDRRGFLLGAAASLAARARGRATGLAPPVTYVAARFTTDGRASVAAFDLDGRELFAAPLDARGHDIAADPRGRDLIVFARRPGTFAVILDRRTGAVRQTIQAAPARHFYGHGVYSADGRWLYATENDFEAGEGLIGVYDVAADYQRVDEWASHGVGPHDIALMADGRTLVVANGGIKTHPSTGRELLNRETMRPSVAFLEAGTGDLIERVELGEGERLLSLRHIALTRSGAVVFGGQWEGDIGESPFLVGTVSRTSGTRLFEMPDGAHARLKGYVGSVAVDPLSGRIAATAPRGGVVTWFDASGDYRGQEELPDACGVAPIRSGPGFVVTSGNSGIRIARASRSLERLGDGALARFAWDNHAIALA